MIDSFLIGAFAYFPRVLIQPELLPYHPAALENFFSGRIMSWMSRKWRCIAVKRGERDMYALSQMIKSLKGGTMIIFPEGTRSRTGRINPGRVGVGKLIHDTQNVLLNAGLRAELFARFAGRDFDLPEWIPPGRDVPQHDRVAAAWERWRELTEYYVRLWEETLP